jgi:hypothetical protein
MKIKHTLQNGDVVVDEFANARRADTALYRNGLRLTLLDAEDRIIASFPTRSILTIYYGGHHVAKA